MSDEELIARLRDEDTIWCDDIARAAADRIEALVKARDDARAYAAEIRLREKSAEDARISAEARSERLEAALEHYACNCDPNSDICTSAGGSNGCGGIARAALKGADHE